MLPLFVGPPGSEREVARRYARFAEAVAPLGSPLGRIVLTPRFAWQLRVGSGLNILLGRDAHPAGARPRRLVADHRTPLQKNPSQHETGELRQPDSFAPS